MKNYSLVFIFFMILTSCFAGRKVENKKTPAPYGEQKSDQAYDWKSFFDEEQSDFFISRLSARARLNEDSIDGETGIYSYVEYTFTMTIKSRANNQTVNYQNFVIKGRHGEEIFHVETNRNGEASWTEKIDFDQQRPQMDSVLVLKEVIGQGAAKGTAHAIYEINPWALTESSIQESFRNLTNDRHQLESRHPQFNPDFNYVAFLVNKEEDEAQEPMVNVRNARFYIAKEEKILDSLGSLDFRSYRRSVSPLRESQGQDAYSRGNLYQAYVPSYVLREETEKGAEVSPVGMNLSLSANISLERKYWIGDKENYSQINQGRFLVFAAILGSNQGIGAPILLSISKNPKVVEVKNKILNVKFDMFTPYLVNRGDIEIALKVIPVDGLAQRGLKPFGTIYKVGNYKNLDGFSGDFQSSVAAEEGFVFDDYLKAAKHFSDEHKELLLEEGYLREGQDTIFSAMQIKFRTVKAGETATQRTVIFSVTTCPYDGLTGRSLDKGQQFKVLVSGLDPLSNQYFDKVPLSEIRQDGGDSIAHIRDDSCLSWTDEIAHKYYQRENLIDREYYLVAGDKEYKLKGYFNPWDEKYGTLGVDSRTLSDSFLEEIQERKKLPSRFFVGDFSYMTLRFRYDVDKDMNLTVKKTVLMTLYPFVKRYSNIINGINGNFPIRDGVYLIKLAYQKDYIDPGAPGVELNPDPENNTRVRVNVTVDGNKGGNRLDKPFVEDDLRRKTMIHTTKKLIRVENNRVITPIEFEIEDLRTLRIRSNLLLQLEPVNQYKLQIVNLFERHIAQKLTAEIGKENKLHCLPPDYKDKVFKVFQQTLDDIALAIPDDVNYNSLGAFKEVIYSEGVQEALHNLTESSLLSGLSTAFNLGLDEETIDKAFHYLSLEELGDMDDVESLEEAIALEEEARERARQESDAEQELVSEQNKTIFSVLDRLASEASGHTGGNTGLVPFGEEAGSGTAVDGPTSSLGDDERVLEETVDELQGYRAEDEKPEETLSFLAQISHKENLQTLINNDFTIDPAVARVSDLDYLIDRKAGIIRRTFVGPLTLIALDNKNTMLATDALNDCSNDDCSEQNVRETYSDYLDGDYSKNPNFGYQGHFKNCHVDDFILREDQEALVYEAWRECVSRDLVKSGENKISIPKEYVCDYSSTQAYQKNPDVFNKYVRRGTELEADLAGACPYREVWLKKRFAQKRTEIAKKQFANFLMAPGITSRLVVKSGDETNLKVTEVSEKCLENDFINEDCLVETDEFNLSTQKLAESLSAYRVRIPRKSIFNNDLDLQEGPYKKTLESFYNFVQGKRLSDLDQDQLADKVYDVLLSVAAPENNLKKYYERLDQAGPADFGVDVQKFMCNLLIPQALSSYMKESQERIARYDEDPNHQDHGLIDFNKMLWGLESDLKKCHSYAETDSIEVPLPFHIERKFRVLDTGRYFFRGGKSINFTISGNVGLSHSRNWSNGYRLDPYNGALGLAEKIPLAGQLIGSAKGFFKLTDYSRSESNSSSDGLSLGTSTHLSMQAAQLDLELTKYRRCALVRWNPKFLARALSYSDQVERISSSSNIFVCSQEESDPIAIRENYYYVTQHFTEGDLLDSGSLLNNPWLLNLRGYRDMVAFVTSLYPQNDNFEPTLEKLMADDLDRIFSKRDVFTSGQVRHSERRVSNNDLEAWITMSKAYRAVTPAFPGLFTQLNDQESSMPDWPWNQEVQIDLPDTNECH